MGPAHHIAKLFKEVTNDVYLAGMWTSSLLEQLDWWVDQPCLGISMEYRAPSWSLGSLDGPIRPHHQAARTQFLVSITAVTRNYGITTQARCVTQRSACGVTLA